MVRIPRGFPIPPVLAEPMPALAEIGGTATASIDEDDIVAGGKTITITLTGDTWVDGDFNNQRQNIIDGLNSAQSESTGWNLEVRDKEVVTAVVRSSPTLVTITLTASSLYDITAQETITVTVPSTALERGIVDVIGDATFTVSAVGVAGTLLTIGSNMTGGHARDRGGMLT